VATKCWWCASIWLLFCSKCVTCSGVDHERVGLATCVGDTKSILVRIVGVGHEHDDG